MFCLHVVSGPLLWYLYPGSRDLSSLSLLPPTTSSLPGHEIFPPYIKTSVPTFIYRWGSVFLGTRKWGKTCRTEVGSLVRPETLGNCDLNLLTTVSSRFSLSHSLLCCLGISFLTPTPVSIGTFLKEVRFGRNWYRNVENLLRENTVGTQLPQNLFYHDNQHRGVRNLVPGSLYDLPSNHRTLRLPYLSLHSESKRV